MKQCLLALLVSTSLAGFGSAQVVSLAPNAPVTVSPSPPDTDVFFSMTPTAGSFNAVGLASTINYTLAIWNFMTPTVTSAQSSTATEFVLVFQDVPPPNGFFGSGDPSGSVAPHPPAVLEHVMPQVVAANALVSTSVPGGSPGHVLKLLSMTINTNGLQDFLVTGDPSLRWYLFDVGTPTVWRPRADRLAEGQVGGVGATLNLASGNYALVVARDGGVSSADLSFTARLAGSSSHVTLPGPRTSVGGLINPNYQFTATPQANRWNAVGIFGTLVNGFTVFMGSAVSGASGNSTGYVVANGRLGAITPPDGLLAHSGTLAGTLHQAGIQTIGVGSPGTTAWLSSSLLHLFEFEILTAAHYDLSVTGSAGLAWAVFAPGSSPSWRPRADALTSASVGAPQNGILLAPGWHAIAVSKAGFGSPGGTITCSVGLSAVPFRRGDCNGDGGPDISDAIFHLDFLFGGGAPSNCRESCDSNDDAEEDLSDAVYLLAHLFTGGPAPGAPFPGCGPDPKPADSMGCGRQECR